MDLVRSDAVALLEGLGFKGMRAITKKRLESKINKLGEVVDDDTEVDDDEVATLLKRVMKTLNNGEKIAIVNDGEVTEEKDFEEDGNELVTEPEDKKEDEEMATISDVDFDEVPIEVLAAALKKKKLAARKGKMRIRNTKGRPFYAGQVIGDLGVANEITSNMIEEVNKRVGKPNDKESRTWLKFAMHVVRGYTSQDEDGE